MYCCLAFSRPTAQQARTSNAGEKGDEMISTAARRKTLESFIGLQSAGKMAGGTHAISRIEAFRVPGSGTQPAYSVLEVETRSGMTGYGECYPLSRADVEVLNGLVGKPAHAYEALMPIAPEPARGGLNMALLDIVGKITKAPIYRVLGGPTRFKVRAIARLKGSSNTELIADMQGWMASGVRSFLIPVMAPPDRNQGSLFIKNHVERFEALRAAAPEADFAVESLDQLTPSDAGMLAAALESLHPLWFDEPCPVTNLSTLRKIAEETVTPIGLGRDIRNAGTFQDLLREGLVDLVRPDLLTYGISGVCRIAAMSETYYTAVAPRHSAGPIALAAALQAAASMPNFFVLQVPDSGAASNAIDDGFFELPKEPGLGIAIDPKQWEGNKIA
jgi:galactonate dehydratase